jgi:TrwC relaxase
MTATFSVWSAGSAAGATAMAQYLSGPALDHERAKYLGAPELRPDLAPALAERLGIDPSVALTEDAISHLFNARKADGNAIEGKRVNKPMRSLVETFGLDPVQRPEGEALANVLAGRRVDGSEVAGPVAGALKRFDAAMAPRADYERLIHATKAPVGGIDLTFSADKSLSVSFALGSEPDRLTILSIHQRAVADAMAFVEKKIGFATVGAGGKDGIEPGTLAWVSFQHFTARPAVDIIRTDKDGAEYTDRREVPMQKPDPQIHSHVAVLNHVHTAGSRLGAIDLDLLKGFVHQAGAVYHARIAAYAGQAGIETALVS